MNGAQSPSQRVPDFKEVVEIGPGVVLTKSAVAELVNAL